MAKLQRCKECGGTHTPKCRPASRRAEADIWRGILGKLTHIRDLRLFNNAGMEIPTCKAGARLLDTGRRYQFAGKVEATCARCKAQYERRYGHG